MHRTRLIAALIILPLLILYIMFLPPVYFLFLIMVISFIAQSEFYSLCRIENKYKIMGLFVGLLLMYQVYRGDAVSEPLMAAGFFAVATVRLFTKGSADMALKDISYTIMGIVYIPLLLGYQVKLREIGAQWIIYMDCSVWAADSLAYYFGKSFGKKKLYEAISPNKTVVGAYGSLAGAVLLSVVLNQVLVKALTVTQAVVIGLVIGAVSIVGDLVESMMKRDSGIKDSSGIIPGHGGILDKIDGIVFVTPVVYWIITRIL